MNTKLLRQKILDLAIRGKLTQQLKSDGTARDLLTQISDERRKTRDERKGTRSKKSGVILSGARSAKSKDPEQIVPLDKSEAPFEIPANWEWVRLGDYLDVRDGTHDSPKYVENGYPFVTSKNLTNGLIDFSTCKRISKLDFEKFEERSHVDDCDILYAMIGSIGNPVLVKKTCDFAIKNVALFKKRNEFTDMHFVFYWLQFVEKDLKVNAAGGLQPFVSLSMFRERSFPLPPLAEQQRIVAKIEDAFAEIDAVEKNKELLKTHIKQTRQKILDLAIHGKLVPQDKNDEPASVLLERITRDNPHYEKIEDEPFEIPENWIWAKLPDVCRAPITDGTHNSPPNTNEGEFFYITAKNIKDDGVDLSNVSYVSKKIHNSIVSRCCPEKGDVLLTKDGTIGNATVNNLNQPFSLLSSVALIKTHRKVLPWYIVFCLRSSYLQKSMKNDAKGTALKRVILSQINDFVIPLPPFNEQSRIVAKIEELFSTLDQMERNLV